MAVRPSKEEIRDLAGKGGYKVCPVSVSILSDIKTPIEVLKILKANSTHVYMLESVEDSQKWGRYTFLGFDPKLEITCFNGEMRIDRKIIRTNEPGKYLREIMKDYVSPRFDYLPTFTGGLVGYFSYDYIKYAEPSLKLDAEDNEHFKDCDLMLFDKVIAFDNLKQKIILIANIKLDNIDSEYDRAVRELDELVTAAWWKRQNTTSRRATSSRSFCPTGWKQIMRAAS